MSETNDSQSKAICESCEGTPLMIGLSVVVITRKDHDRAQDLGEELTNFFRLKQIGMADAAVAMGMLTNKICGFVRAKDEEIAMEMMEAQLSFVAGLYEIEEIKH